MIAQRQAPPATSDAPLGLRLDQRGDLLTIEEYTRWARNGSIKTTYNQLSRGKCLVAPHAIKPKPIWRRSDLEAWLGQGMELLVAQRRARAKKRLQLVGNGGPS